MVLRGTVEELARRILGGAYRIHLEAEGPHETLERALEGVEGVVRVERSDTISYLVEAQRDLRAQVARAVHEAGGSLLSLDMELPSLDEVYARYFQQEVSHDAG